MYKRDSGFVYVGGCGVGIGTKKGVLGGPRFLEIRG
jgi:hypothetical protein